MIRLAIASATTAAFALFAIASPAVATSNPYPYSASISVYSDNPALRFTQYTPGLGSPDGQAFEAEGGTFSVAATANDFAGGTVAASSSATLTPTSQITGTSASALASYRFSLDGPDGSLVPVLVNAEGTGSGTGFATISDIFQIFSYSTPQYFAVNESGIFDYSDTIYFQANTEYFLTERVDVEAGVPYYLGESSTAFAQIDPTFTIESDFATLYHFDGLPASAIGSQSTVPEPSGWLMMIAGFWLVGCIQRRQVCSPIGSGALTWAVVKPLCERPPSEVECGGADDKLWAGSGKTAFRPVLTRSDMRI